MLYSMHSINFDNALNLLEPLIWECVRESEKQATLMMTGMDNSLDEKLFQAHTYDHLLQCLYNSKTVVSYRKKLPVDFAVQKNNFTSLMHLPN